MAENLQLSPYDQSFPPIVSKRNPTAKDKAELGQIWINKTLNDAFILTSVVAGVSTWINAGGGSGTFSSLTIAGASLFNGTVTASTFGKGVVFSSAAGLLSSAAGTNGQLIVGKTGDSPLWATPTSLDGSLVVTLGANSLDFSVSGATVSSFPTDAGVANPVLGATSILGGTNIGTTGVGGVVTINLDASPSVAGSLTAGVDLNMTSGTCTITSNTNAASAIYLHANAGVGETINIYSQQGTGVDSVNVHSLAGGITVAGGKAAATAVNLTAFNAAGGITLTAGTAGVTSTISNGAFTVNTGTGAIDIGTDAVAKIVTIGNAIGGTGVIVNSGTGDIALSSQDKVVIDSVNDMELNSSAGNINIATDAIANTTTIGNATGVSSVIVNVGTGAFDLGVTATDHTSRLGSTTGVSALTLQAGTGAMTCTAGGAFDVNAVGAVTVDSTGAAISIGNGADAFGINIGTGAAQRNIILGNATGTTSVVVNGGTGVMQFGANAIAHDVTVGSVTGAANTSLLSGTGLLNLASLGSSTYSAVTTLDIDTAGALSINSSAGIINIGNDAVAQNIYIGTGAAARTVTIGNITTTTGVAINTGTAGLIVDSKDEILLDAVGLLELNSSGAAISIGNDAVAQGINIGTGAAARTIIVGNNTTTTGIQITSGTGDIALNSQDAVSVQAVGAVDIDTAGVVSINSTAGALNIGNDANAQAINIGTGAAARTIIIGNNTTTTGVQITAGSGEISCNTDVNLTTAGTAFVFQEGPKIFAGAGSPHGSLVAPKGSLFLATNGSGVGDRAYINTDGNTTWTAITTVA